MNVADVMASEFSRGREAGHAEGRRQGLEEAAKIVADAQAEVQRNIDENIAEACVAQVKRADNYPLIQARDWLRHSHEIIQSRIKETE
jgi:hypothetical protein